MIFQSGILPPDWKLTNVGYRPPDWKFTPLGYRPTDWSVSRLDNIIIIIKCHSL